MRLLALLSLACASGLRDFVHTWKDEVNDEPWLQEVLSECLKILPDSESVTLSFAQVAMISYELHLNPPSSPLVVSDQSLARLRSELDPSLLEDWFTAASRDSSKYVHWLLFLAEYPEIYPLLRQFPVGHLRLLFVVKERSFTLNELAALPVDDWNAFDFVSARPAVWAFQAVIRVKELGWANKSIYRGTAHLIEHLVYHSWSEDSDYLLAETDSAGINFWLRSDTEAEMEELLLDFVRAVQELRTLTDAVLEAEKAVIEMESYIKLTSPLRQADQLVRVLAGDSMGILERKEGTMKKINAEYIRQVLPRFFRADNIVLVLHSDGTSTRRSQLNGVFENFKWEASGAENSAETEEPRWELVQGREIELWTSLQGSKEARVKGWYLRFQIPEDARDLVSVMGTGIPVLQLLHSDVADSFWIKCETYILAECIKGFFERMRDWDSEAEWDAAVRSLLGAYPEDKCVASIRSEMEEMANPRVQQPLSYERFRRLMDSIGPETVTAVCIEDIASLEDRAWARYDSSLEVYFQENVIGSSGLYGAGSSRPSSSRLGWSTSSAVPSWVARLESPRKKTSKWVYIGPSRIGVSDTTSKTTIRIFIRKILTRPLQVLILRKLRALCKGRVWTAFSGGFEFFSSSSQSDLSCTDSDQDLAEAFRHVRVDALIPRGGSSTWLRTLVHIARFLENRNTAFPLQRPRDYSSFEALPPSVGPHDSSLTKFHSEVVAAIKLVDFTDGHETARLLALSQLLGDLLNKLFFFYGRVPHKFREDSEIFFYSGFVRAHICSHSSWLHFIFDTTVPVHVAEAFVRDFISRLPNLLLFWKPKRLTYIQNWYSGPKNAEDGVFAQFNAHLTESEFEIFKDARNSRITLDEITDFSRIAAANIHTLVFRVSPGILASRPRLSPAAATPATRKVEQGIPAHCESDEELACDRSVSLKRTRTESG